MINFARTFLYNYMKRIYLKFRGEEERRHSSERVIHVNGGTNGALTTKNKRGGLKILKKTIYDFSGMFSCLLVLFMFIFMAVGCEKPSKIIDTVENDLSSDILKIDFTMVAQGNLNGHHQNLVGKHIIIKTIEEWDSLKTNIDSLMGGDGITHGFIETGIDFSAYQVIAIFDVIHLNGGWTIDIIDITEYADKIIVTVSNLNTGNITAIVTNPFHIVKIPVSDKEFVFQLI
jgi:hypothetical protein